MISEALRLVGSVGGEGATLQALYMDEEKESIKMLEEEVLKGRRRGKGVSMSGLAALVMVYSKTVRKKKKGKKNPRTLEPSKSAAAV